MNRRLRIRRFESSDGDRAIRFWGPSAVLCALLIAEFCALSCAGPRGDGAGPVWDQQIQPIQSAARPELQQLQDARSRGYAIQLTAPRRPRMGPSFAPDPGYIAAAPPETLNPEAGSAQTAWQFSSPAPLAPAFDSFPEFGQAGRIQVPTLKDDRPKAGSTQNRKTNYQPGAAGASSVSSAKKPAAPKRTPITFPGMPNLPVPPAPPKLTPPAFLPGKLGTGALPTPPPSISPESPARPTAIRPPVAVQNETDVAGP